MDEKKNVFNGYQNAFYVEKQRKISLSFMNP